MSFSDRLKSLLESKRPLLHASTTRLLTHSFESWLSNWPRYTTDLGIVFYETLKFFVDDPYRRQNAPGVLPTINADRLRKYVDHYVEVTLTALFVKLSGKVGDLESPTCKGDSHMDFTLTGIREGQQVLITQRMIVNVSSRGKLFNQYPASIYVDGKKMSEAAYKAKFS